MQCGFYYSMRMSRLFKEVISREQPDLYVSHLLRMSRYIEENDLIHQSILEMTDALSKTYELSSQSAIGGLKEIIYWLERDPIRKSELNAIRAYPKVVLVSQQDIDFLCRLNSAGTSSLALHTNGVECVDNLPASYDCQKICFVGNMRTLQNQDAVRRFLTDIFPVVKQKIPGARFYIVGSYPPESIKKLADGKNVYVTGYVDDLHSMLKDSCIAVAPVEIAAGIQNKVLGAMGCGVPVVMSSLISKAIPQLEHNGNCMICNDNASFADCCVNLMTNSELRDKIAYAGYNMVRTNYSWEEKLRGYELFPN